MAQITLNTNSWHFKYYSAIISDTPPKSLCPYFWTMVILIILSPVLLTAMALIYINKKLSNFFDDVLPKKKQKKDERSFEELAEAIRKSMEARRVREERWNKAGDIIRQIVKYVIAPIAVVLGLYFVFTTGNRIGWLNVLITTGIALVAMLGIFGAVVLMEKLGRKINAGFSFVWNNYNPFKWKGFKIMGEMIVATYTNMCPLITWEGEDKNEIV